jgi:L-histidine N-alpha-methyltransferase
LLAAYDDAAGVTAAFNRNMLHVMNRELGADFPTDDFEYVATWDPNRACVEMGLRATRGMNVSVEALGITISLTEGELIHNEVSCKFTRTRFEADLDAAGLSLLQWHTDHQDRYAVALATPQI